MRNPLARCSTKTRAVTQAFVQDQFDIGRLTSRLALGGVDHETFGNELTWNAEFGAAFGTGTRVTLSGGTAFRAPDSTDRFGFGGNPDLDPEVSEQVEISVRQKLGEHHQLSLSAFDNRIEDLIDYVIIDFDTFEGQNQNVERAHIKGVELGYNLRERRLARTRRTHAAGSARRDHRRAPAAPLTRSR